ncbi:MAG: hypothetical protein P4L33_06565 [Capsulimonadaceae bacterium]|nr:hypothetical protein [Capsulimonadaceae bacterium]
MAQTIYASFADAAQCERAAGALLDHGARAIDLSLVANSLAATRSSGGQYDAESPGDAAGETDSGETTSGWRGGATRPSSIDRPTGSAATPALGSGYDAGAYPVANPYDAEEKPQSAKPWNIERAAKIGISTTTAYDATAGAAKGAGIGLGVGVFAGLAALVVPGAGIVVGSGALASAIGVAFSATAAGALAGGITGYFIDQGVDAHIARRYNETITNGGGILAITVPSNSVDAVQAQAIIHKYGATHMSNF